MKKIIQSVKLKSHVFAPLLAIMILLAPAVSLADNGNNNGNGNKNGHDKDKSEKVEQKMEQKINRFGLKLDAKLENKSDDNDNSGPKVNAGNNSIWTRFFNFLNGSGFFFGNIRVGSTTGSSTATSSNSSLAPNISSITAPTVLKVGETGTWTVNASDPQNGSLSYSVNWGDNLVQPLLAGLAQPVFVQTATFTHAYANAGKYTVKFTVTDNTGLKTNSSVTVYVTNSAENAPVISNVMATSSRPHQAVVSWTTDVRSTSRVWFSKTSPVDTSGSANVSNALGVFNHKVNLAGLDADTKYYVVVGSSDNAGLTKSSETSFVTPKIVVNGNLPVIIDLNGSSTITVGETETIIVHAYDPRNLALTYSVNWGDSAPSIMSMLGLVQPVFVQTATFSHVYGSAGTYTAKFTVRNSDGQKASSSVNIVITPMVVVDTNPPFISAVGSLTGSSTSVISWTTNEPSTSAVFYSTSTPVNVNSSSTPVVSSSSLVTSHSLTVSGLATSTQYHFVVKSTDTSGNASTSSEATFATGSGL